MELYFQAVEQAAETWQIVKQLPNYETVVGEQLFRQIFDISPTALSLYSFAGDQSPEAVYQSPSFLQHAQVVVHMLEVTLEMMLGDDMEKLAKALHSLGCRHVDYGVLPAHYNVVETALLRTLADALGERWTDQVRKGWAAVFKFIGKAMRTGAGEELQIIKHDRWETDQKSPTLKLRVDGKSKEDGSLPPSPNRRGASRKRSITHKKKNRRNSSQKTTKNNDPTCDIKRQRDSALLPPRRTSLKDVCDQVPVIEVSYQNGAEKSMTSKSMTSIDRRFLDGSSSSISGRGSICNSPSLPGLMFSDEAPLKPTRSWCSSSRSNNDSSSGSICSILLPPTDVIVFCNHSSGKTTDGSSSDAIPKKPKRASLTDDEACNLQQSFVSIDDTTANCTEDEAMAEEHSATTDGVNSHALHLAVASRSA